MQYFDIYNDGYNFKFIYFVFDYFIKYFKVYGYVGNERYKRVLMSNILRSLEIF